MGLETHVDRIIGETDPALRGAYVWRNGMQVTEEDEAARLLEVLNASGQFGQAYLDGCTIKFGLFRDFLPEVPARIWVPADYRTWFERGDPPVAYFRFGTEVRISGRHSEHWLAARTVSGFLPGRTVLFSTMDVGRDLIVLE